MELNREHFRAIIYYNFQRQSSQQECLPELLSVFGNEAPHQSTISRWYGECKREWVNLSDDPRVGAPKTAVTQENADAVRKLIIEDRHVTYREIEAAAARVNWCQRTLDRFNSGNSKNVYRISGDESWIYCEEKPTKVVRSRSVSKKMVATFVSKAGHIATIPLNEQRTVTADSYICLPKIIAELRKINPERRIILHQDNASSHTAQPQGIAVDAFKNAVLDLPANEWNKCFENWFERMQMIDHKHAHPNVVEADMAR
ncbi:unnamed protein product [Acanthoscelides obtectus]|uniref:Mos1 transposase HTH domain-containing protein n=1 Tax=Acanthoscelides obtectus TaxID=200917 RepID=A0A9P0JSB0_ACAOB|nr:unnamed protein product [Acanthoscelides obtectus]CAK1663803.1 hypothetical protein AOBTE_LOCUS23862 [Acanthoscelides obtectus]